MSTQIGRTLPFTSRARRLHSSMPAWVVGLAAASVVPFLLPIPGSPPALAGFIGLSGILILFARHWLIAVLPVLAALGPYFLPIQAMGVNVFGFRLVIMLLALFSTPLTTRGGWWFNPVARWATMFMAFWVFWGLLSLFWTPDVSGGLNDIITLVFAFGLLLALFSLNAYRAEHLDKLRIGWILALAFAGGSAALEIFTGSALPRDISAEIATSAISLERALYDPAIRSTFGYSGHFGGFLLLTVPFVLWSIERARGPVKLIYLLTLAAVGALILYSASRLSLIGFIVQLLVYGLALRRRWYMPFVVLVGGVAAMALYTSVILESDLRVAEKLNKAAESGGADSSMQHRVALTLNGLWMAYKTAGRGVGAAGFEEEISGDVPIPLPIRYLQEWNAHNFWVEVLSEYGVLVFAAFMALLGWIGLLAWRAQRRPGGASAGAAGIGRVIILGLLGYVFYCVTAGSPMAQAFHWMFVISLLIMAAFLHDELRRHGRRADWPGLQAPAQAGERRVGPYASSPAAVRPSR